MKRFAAAICAFAIAFLLLGAPARAQTNAATTNGSATITTGNTFQAVLAALAAPPATRRSLTIENNNASDNCWVDFGVRVNGTLITADTYRPLEVYTVVALIYFAMLFPSTLLAQAYERHLAKGR